MQGTVYTDQSTATEAPASDRDQELVAYLERDQLVHDKSRPIARANLSRRARVGLWALRIFVIVVSAMVIYTFVSQVA